MKGVTNCSYFGFFQIDLKKRNIEVVLKFLNAVKGRFYTQSKKVTLEH